VDIIKQNELGNEERNPVVTTKYFYALFDYVITSIDISRIFNVYTEYSLEN